MADLTQRVPAASVSADARLFQAMFTLSGVGFAESEPQSGRFVRINPAFAEITGYSEDELLSMSVFDVTHPEDRAADRADFERMLSGATPSFDAEKRYLRKDGATVWVHVTATLLLDERGHVQRSVCLVYDISDRMRTQEALRESERELSAIFQLAGSGKTVTRVSDGRFVRVNARQCELSGYTEQELLQRSFLDITHPDDRERDRQAFQEMVAGAREEIQHEKRYVRKDGRAIWVLVSARLMHGEHGAPLFVIATVQDIDERKRFENALRESEERYRRLVETANEGIWVVDMQAGTQLAYRRMAEILGCTVEDMHVRTVLDFVFPDDRAAIQRRIDANLAGKSEEFDFRFRRLDGSAAELLGCTSPVTNAEGRVVGALGMFTDISPRRKAEDALLESQARWKSLFHNAPFPVWEEDFSAIRERFDVLRARGVTDLEAHLEAHPDEISRLAGLVKILDVSHSTAEAFGIRDVAVLSRSLAEFFDAESLAVFGKEMVALWRGETTFVSEIPVHHPAGGGTRLLELHLSVVPGYERSLARVLASFVDITDRKRAEEALRESEERFRFVADNAPVMIWMALPDGAATFLSRAWLDFRGRKAEEELGKGWTEGLHPDDAERTLATYRRAAKQQRSFTIDYRFCRADGEYRWLAGAATPLVSANGRLSGYIGSCLDITERKEAERAVQQLNRDLKNTVDELQTLLHAAPIGVVVAHDPACAYVTVNPAGARMLGTGSTANVSLSGPDARQLPFKVSSHGTEIAPESLPLQYAAAHGMELRDVEMQIVRADASSIDIVMYASPLHDEKGAVRGALGIMVDLTERRRAEEELAKAQKLESIGVLAGGIAHDFNNILTSLFGNIELAKLYADGNDVITDPLLQAEKAFKRARDLTQRLLTFSKGGAPLREIVSVADIVRESVSFALHGTNVLVEFDIAPDLSPAFVDAGQLGQAINNLAINANEAMPEGGRLRVDARNVTLGADNAFRLTPGRYLEIHVKDWGVGIDQEHLRKIFDPYFTTKARGTGLGLSVVYSVITRHGGHIAAQSKSGKGTTFTIYLPASRQEPPGRTPERTISIGRKKPGRILVMDDEPGVQDIAKGLLGRLGYDIEVAGDGDKAVELFRAARNRGQAFDAVILDLTIPGGMGGKECVQRLREIEPDVNALVSSGYSNDPVLSRPQDYGFRGVVSKPYLLSDLCDALGIFTDKDSEKRDE